MSGDETASAACADDRGGRHPHPRRRVERAEAAAAGGEELGGDDGRCGLLRALALLDALGVGVLLGTIIRHLRLMHACS